MPLPRAADSTSLEIFRWKPPHFAPFTGTPPPPAASGSGMNLNRDLTQPWLIHLKGILFVVLGVAAGTLLVLELPSLKTAALLLATVWAFCRFYYYLFYVLDHYLGREKRFAGVFDALRFLLTERRREAQRD